VNERSTPPAVDPAEFLAALVGSSEDAIIGKDLNGVVMSWNGAAERLYGYSAAEMVGRNIAELVPDDRPDEVPGILARLRRGERIEHFETVRRRRDGVLVDVALTISPVRNASGSVIAASTIARNITQEKAIRRRLEQYTSELERSNRDLERFAYVVSHDLAEPLRMVTSYVQLLAEDYRGRLDSDADEYIRYAVDGTRRMHALIQDLLLYSRIGTGELNRSPVATGDLVAEAVRNLGTTMADAGAEVVSGDLPTVVGDRIKLVPVFQNLIGNAVKFRSADRPPRVEISAERADGGWTFTVADNGIGIDAKYEDRIFEVFQRLHTRDEYPGTGIGLSVCRRVIERHGGRIWLERNGGPGTTFKFLLPDA
jgi:PAS domain S-box-containing protein